MFTASSFKHPQYSDGTLKSWIPPGVVDDHQMHGFLAPVGEHCELQDTLEFFW
jgi:hypothetical protein